MPTLVSINGEIFAEADAKISVFDRGFLYGDSVFEVYRTYDGVPFAEQEHLERLERSADRLLIAMPVAITELAREAREAHAASGNTDSYVRLVITRGSGPLTYDLTTAKDPTRVIIVAPVPTVPASHYRDGVAVRIMQVSRPTDDPQAAGVKASNYLANLLAVHHAKQQGAHEAIITGRLPILSVAFPAGTSIAVCATAAMAKAIPVQAVSSSSASVTNSGMIALRTPNDCHPCPSATMQAA